jgi:signal transduction histidine kinase
MTSGFILRRTSLTVGRRLFLGLLPALLAVVLAVGLAYYGEFHRQVPAAVAIGAGALAVVSLVVTWVNTRYLAGRIVRLSGAMTASRVRDGDASGADEFDRIERVVDHLGSALSAAEAQRRHADAASAARLHEQATMLAGVVRDAIGQLEEVRLPLHILLETRFGELNENQEELLRDARKAADAMDAALRRLGQVADADRDALPVKPELVQVNDVIRAVLPLTRAAAERTQARVDALLEPGLPRVMADRARLAEALALLTDNAAAGTGPELPLAVSTARDGEGVSITIAPRRSKQESSSSAAATATTVRDSSMTVATPGSSTAALATRLIAAQGGSTETTDHGLIVRLPGFRSS